MVDYEKLKDAIQDSGKPMSLIAKESGILRETLYNRLKGIGEFTASEIIGLTKSLRLSKKQRDDIFLNKKLN